MDDFFSEFVLSNKPAYRIGRHFFFWLVCWMFMGFIYGFYSTGGDQTKNFLYSYRDALLYMPQHIALSYGIIYFILPRYILRNEYWKGLAGIIVLIIFAAILSPIILNLVIVPLHDPSYAYGRRNLFYSFMGGLRGSTTIAGFAVALKLVKYWYFKKVENQILEKENLKAELQLLRGQLHPHFIFNTLNSIYSLALKKSEDTPDSILKLSELMRYILTECNGTTISLEREIEMLHYYIKLEKNRFRDRIDMAINITGDFENKNIAPLLFLPFVENSFKYGANEMLEHAWISLDLNVKDQQLKFKLINGKNGHPKKILQSSGIGLQNVKKRLGMLYPLSHELRITEDADTFIVQLTLQLDEIKIPESDEETELSFSR